MRFRFPTSGQAVVDAETITQIIRGNSLKTLAPANLRGSRNTAGDLLVEWDRRDRLPRPLIDGAGVPLSEQAEIYVIEIYSGSTLKRTFRVRADRLASDALRWRFGRTSGLSGSATPVFSDDGSVSFSNAGTFGPVSQQVFEGDFTLEIGAAPGNVRIPNAIYIIKAGTENDVVIPPPSFFLFRTAGTVNSQALVADGTNQASFDLTFPARGFIVRTGSEIKAHLGSAFQTSHPVLTGNKDYTGPLVVLTFESETGFAATLHQPRVSTIRIRSVLYTAAMQIADFGSVQNPIKVRARGESAIVGVGYYSERML